MIFTHPYARLAEDINGPLSFLGKEMLNYCDLVSENKGTQYRFWVNQRSPEISAAISQCSGKKLRIPISLAEKLNQYELGKLLLIFDHLIINQDTVTNLSIINNDPPAVIKTNNSFDGIVFKPMGSVKDIALFSPVLPQVPGLDKVHNLEDLLSGPIDPYILIDGNVNENGQEFTSLMRVGDAFLNHPSWAFGKDYRSLIENGMLVIGGTIPGKDIDQELLSNGVDLSSFYGPILSRLQDQNRDITKNAQAMLKMEIPILQGLTCDQLSKIINDDPTSFNKFRTHLLEGLKQIEQSQGEYNFNQKVKVIKKEIIDDGINELDEYYEKTIKSVRAFRAAGYSVGAMGLWAAIYLNIPEIASAFAVGSPVAIALKEKSDRIKEKATLKNEPCYFLWQIGK